MSYAVTVDARRPEDAPGLDPLQRAGVVHLLREGLDAIESIEDEDGQIVEITDHFIGVHPDGALLKVFVEAPTLEDAEAAVGAVIGEILEHSELLSDWTVDRCEVELHLDAAEESLQAADGPDAPADGPSAAHSAGPRRGPGPDGTDEAGGSSGNAASAPPGTGAVPARTGDGDSPELRTLRGSLRSLAPRLAGVGLPAFGCLEPQPVGPAPVGEDRTAAEDAELAAGALVHSIDILLDELFEDIETLGDCPSAAECDGGLLQLEGLPPRFAHLYTPLFARRLLVTAVLLTDRLCRPGFARTTCVAEELLLRLLLEAAEATLDLHGLLAPGVRGALCTFRETLDKNLDHDWLYAPPAATALAEDTAPDATPGARSVVVPTDIDAWFTPFDPDTPVHPYTSDTGGLDDGGEPGE